MQESTKGISEIEGKVGEGSNEREREPSEFQSSKGISEIERKTARVAVSDSES